MAEKKQEYVRFSVSVPFDLNEKFENLRTNLDISRSDAIRKGMRLFINESIDEIAEVDHVMVLGTISYVEKAHVHSHLTSSNHTHSHGDSVENEKSSLKRPHSHSNKETSKSDTSKEKESDSYYYPVEQLEFIQINDLQHEYLNEIISTTHIHAGPEQCMIIIAVRGNLLRIRQLIRSLKSFRTIENLKFSVLEKKEV